MHSCDVLIAGGGPAGSACAWRLRDAGFEVIVLDRARFPRDKICGGWITPQVFARLGIDPSAYAVGRVLQPVTAFRVGVIGARGVHADFDSIVSYGIRRCEFDHYLLKRSGARVIDGIELKSLEPSGGGWIANGLIHARTVIGAGGHFCPVARFMGAVNGPAVVAQESEFEMTAAQREQCPIRGDTPELYFSRDLKGYGWCFRKNGVLNAGLGRADPHRLAEHTSSFLRWKLPFEAAKPRGHAYFLYGSSPRRLFGDGWMLAGDSAGLAYPFSGEGILPAIESGLMAAEIIARAQPFSRYPAMLESRFGEPPHWLARLGARLPSKLISAAAPMLLSTHWFTRGVVLDRWFLHGATVV